MAQQLPLEKEMRDLFAKFPEFPDSLREILVKIAPWAVAIYAFLALLGLLAAVGLGSILNLGSLGIYSYGSTWQYWISIIGGGLMAFIYIMAFTPLRARKIRGWNLMYYAFLLSLIIYALTFQIFSLIIGFLIGGWILFQVRPKYT